MRIENTFKQSDETVSWIMMSEQFYTIVKYEQSEPTDLFVLFTNNPFVLMRRSNYKQIIDQILQRKFIHRTL